MALNLAAFTSTNVTLTTLDLTALGRTTVQFPLHARFIYPAQLVLAATEFSTIRQAYPGEMLPR